jgi:hypothetical protein
MDTKYYNISTAKYMIYSIQTLYINTCISVFSSSNDQLMTFGLCRNFKSDIQSKKAVDSNIVWIGRGMRNTAVCYNCSILLGLLNHSTCSAVPLPASTCRSKVVPVLNQLSTTPCRRMGSGCIDPHFLDLDTSWR